MEKLTYGLSFVDELLDGGLHPGDNVLLLAERNTPRLPLTRAFVDVPDRHTVVVDTTGRWEHLRGHDVTVLDWSHLQDPAVPTTADEPRSAGWDPVALADELADIEAEAGSGVYWLFDSATTMQQGLGLEASIGIFLVACPRKIRQGSVALMPVDPDEHDRSFLERIRSAVQIVLELRQTSAGSRLEVTKADGRPADTVGRRVTLRVEDDRFEVGPISSGEQRLGQQLRAERQRRGLSQTQLGQVVGVSASAISQFERGVSGVSGPVLTRLWQTLEVPFGPADDRRHGFRIFRRGDRRRDDLPPGVMGTLLFDDPNVGFGWELTISPNTSRRQGMFAVKATEVVLVRRGLLDLVIAGEERTLSEGDSLVTTEPAVTGWRNPAPEPTDALWFVLGRHPRDEGD